MLFYQAFLSQEKNKFGMIRVATKNRFSNRNLRTKILNEQKSKPNSLQNEQLKLANEKKILSYDQQNFVCSTNALVSNRHSQDRVKFKIISNGQCSQIKKQKTQNKSPGHLCTNSKLKKNNFFSLTSNPQKIAQNHINQPYTHKIFINKENSKKKFVENKKGSIQEIILNNENVQYYKTQKYLKTKTKAKIQQQFPFESLNDSITQQQQMFPETINQLEMQQQHQFQTDQLFRNIERNMQAENQVYKIKKAKQNNMYQILRQKLKNKVINCYQDQQNNQNSSNNKDNQKILALLIQGCNLEKHKRKFKFNSEQKKSSYLKPRTARATKYHEIKLNFKSTLTRPVNTIRKKLQNNFRKSVQLSNDESLKYINTDKIINHSLSNSIVCINQSQSLIGFRSHNPSQHKNQLKPSENCNDLYQNLKTKFDNLLYDCIDQKKQTQKIKRKMKVFRYYSDKMERGFQKIQTKIKKNINQV